MLILPFMKRKHFFPPENHQSQSEKYPFSIPKFKWWTFNARKGRKIPSSEFLQPLVLCNKYLELLHKLENTRRLSRRKRKTKTFRSKLTLIHQDPLRLSRTQDKNEEEEEERKHYIFHHQWKASEEEK